MTCKRNRHQEFLAFLTKVERETPKDKEIHIVLDNHATHKHAAVRKWIESRKRIFLHFAPVGASWLNMVERFFGISTDKRLRRGALTSVKALEKALHHFIERTNEDPRPFVWTKCGREIVDGVRRARQTLELLQAN